MKNILRMLIMLALSPRYEFSAKWDLLTGKRKFLALPLEVKISNSLDVLIVISGIIWQATRMQFEPFEAALKNFAILYLLMICIELVESTLVALNNKFGMYFPGNNILSGQKSLYLTLFLQKIFWSLVTAFIMLIMVFFQY